MSRRLIAATLAVVMVLGAIALALCFPRRPEPKPANTAGSSTVAGRLPRPAARDASYVGSDACRACHPEISKRYLASSMGKSMAAIEDAEPLEDFATGTVDPPGNRLYKVSRGDAGGVTQCEVMLDAEGEPIYEHVEPVHFVVGSGNRGRTYLFEKAGALFQSPIGWYAQATKGWDLSPGYSQDNHPRFSRRVGDGCLYCHAGRLNASKQATDHYNKPVFLEMAIGCERCHGPGAVHVKFHSGEVDPPSFSDTIVNPGKLADSRQSDSICNQCHVLGQSVVPRSGRGFFDFRPGDALEDIYVILAQDAEEPPTGRAKAVSQVEQMHASKCYQASQGRMSCVSCHDPHSTPDKEQSVEHFRQRCLSCHQDSGCGLAEERRQGPPAFNSCIHCHMPKMLTEDVPHTSLTHHGIERRPRKFDADAPPSPAGAPSLRVFADAEPRLPAAEVQRAKAITLMTLAWTRQDPFLAERAFDHFRSVLEPMTNTLEVELAALEDIPFLEELGACFFLLKDANSAAVCWRRLLQLAPHNRTALLGLAKLAEEGRDVDAYREYLDRLSSFGPPTEDVFSMRVQLGYHSGDQNEALEAAEALLKLNPTMVEPRKWLANVYRSRGDDAKARAHETFLNRMGIPLDRKQP